MNKPISPPIPGDGIYWVKWADRTYQYDSNHNITNKSFWKIGEWDLVSIENGSIEVFGSDELIDWNGSWHCVAILGPKVETPE